MKDLSKKQLGIIALVIILVFGTIIWYICKKQYIDNSAEEEIVSEISNNINTVNEMEETNQILIHIYGNINNQGIIVLKQGARIIDAIEAAGGENDNADLNKLNLAYELSDGERLYIPSKDDEDEIEYVSADSGNNVLIEGTGNNENESKLININTAGISELVTLNGVGESTANKIIMYRETNGKFSIIEDIKNVPGIGDAKFESIKNFITV